MLDAVISDLYFSDSAAGFSLFSFLASYFYTCLVISWHRVVIHGPDNYVPMNPFKPQKHELVFIGVGFLIGVILFISGFVMGFLSVVLKAPVIGIAIVPMLCVALYVVYRLMFFFPAKAVNAQITLKEAYDMSKGYLWKVINASFFASYRVILLALAYMVVLMIALIACISMFGTQIVETSTSTIGFIVMLPLFLYIQPLLTVLGITAVSNYYLHALRNAE